MAKVALAYSGGLDTSIAVKWLKEEKGLDVIACLVDVGQNEDLDELRKRALGTGAAEAIVIDAKDRFAKEFCFTALKANAVYENGYMMHCSLSRPLISEEVVKVALEKGCEYYGHGCTAKGNDQARFEAVVASLAPQLKVIAPVREWDLLTRDQEIEYAQEHKIPVPVTKKSPYSIDINLWGCAIECGILEDPMVRPPKDAYRLTVDPVDAPDEPEIVEITFEKGEPVAVDGKAMDPATLISHLNDVAGRHGVGRLDLVENRLVGIKSREIYEAPGPTTLLQAHLAMEQLVLSRDLARVKNQLTLTFSNLLYDGYWFTDLRAALQAFFEETQKYVTGTVLVELSKGRATVVGRKSDYSLYRHDLATYSEGDAFDRDAAKGFLDILHLPLRVEGARRKQS